MNAIILILAAVLRIASPSEPGQRLVLTGHVFGPDGRPRAGAQIELWHTDATGHYRLDHGDGPARLRGVVRTDADGSYTVETIKPAPYPGTNRGAHIHVRIAGGPTLTLFLDGGQPLLKLTRATNGILHTTYDFHLGGAPR